MRHLSVPNQLTIFLSSLCPSSLSFIVKKKIKKKIFFFKTKSFFKKIVSLILSVLALHCCMGFSLVAASGGYFLVAECQSISLGWLLLLQSWAPEYWGLSSGGEWA